MIRIKVITSVLLLLFITPVACASTSNLKNDPRISKSSAFIKPEACMTIDKTYGEGFSKIASSGFPRPENTSYGQKIGQILVLPVNFTDYKFLDSDRIIYEKSISNVINFYKKMSFSRFSTKFDWAPINEWVNLPKEASYYGITNNKPQQDNKQVVIDAFLSADASLELGKYDAVLVLTNSFRDSGGGQAFMGSNFESKSGIVRNSMLMFGRGISGWPNIAHELGHALFGLEDLYLFQVQDGQKVMQSEAGFTGWDLIAGSTPDFSGWNKFLMNFIHPEEIKCVGDKSKKIIYLSATDSIDGAKLGVINVNPGVSICFEAKKDFDGKIGLLIYKVDTNYDHGNGPFWGEQDLLYSGKGIEFEGRRFKVLASSKTGLIAQVGV